MAGLVQSVELWTNLACSGGTRVAVLDQVTECRTSWRIDDLVVAGSLAVVMPRTWDRSTGTAQSASLKPQAVIRLVYEDGGFDEWRIAEITDHAHQGQMQVQARSPIYDLAQKDQLMAVERDGATVYAINTYGTPTQLLGNIFTVAGPSVWATGTVTPTALLFVVYSGDTPLGAATKVAAAARTATGTTYELAARRNGTTGYYLDLVVAGVSATVPDIRTGKNLGTLTRIQNGHLQATRVVPFGSDGGGPGDNWWEVVTVSAGAYIEVEDLDGGLSPLLADDGLNGYYVVDDAGASHEITDSSVQSSVRARLNMASTTGIAVGEWVRVARDSSGNPIRYVDDLAAQATYGIVLGTTQNPGIPSHTNHAKNGDMADWTGADPDDWTRSGTATTKVAVDGLWLTGGWSAYVPSASTSLTATRSIYVLANASVTYTIWLYVKSWGNNLNYAQFWNPNTGVWENQIPLDGTASEINKLFRWTALSHTVPITASGLKSCSVGITTSTGPVQVYVDAAQIQIGVSAGAFVRHSGGAKLVQAGHRYLRDHSSPPLTYRGTIADLYRLDPSRWPDDDLTLGGTVSVVDADLGVTASVRLVQMDRNELLPAETQVVWSTRRPDLTTYLAGVL